MSRRCCATWMMAPDGESGRLLARAAAADPVRDERAGGYHRRFFLPAESRLDERSRSALAGTLGGLVTAIESAISQHAARLLAARDAPFLAEALASSGPWSCAGWRRSRLLRDGELMRELVGRARQEVLAEALPVVAPEDPDRAGLAGTTDPEPGRRGRRRCHGLARRREPPPRRSGSDGAGPTFRLSFTTA